MKSYTNLLMGDLATVILNGVTAFPLTPKEGEFCFRKDQGILYMYSTIDLLATWYPLTNRTDYYVHTQAIAAASWDIEHGMHSQDLIYFVYDANNTLQFAEITFVDMNNVTITFTEDVAGKCVIFAAGAGFGGVSGATGSKLDGSVDITGTLKPDVTATYNLGSAAKHFNTIYVDNIVGAGAKLDGSTDITGTLKPDLTAAYDLGSATKHFANIYVDNIIGAGAKLDGSTNITGTIVPSVTSTYDLGSSTKTLRAVYADEVFVGAHSLYVNGKKVIEDSSDVIKISTDANQGIEIVTSGVTGGTGTVKVKSDVLIDNILTTAGAVFQAGNGSDTYIKVDSAALTKKVTLSGTTVEILGNMTMGNNLTVTGNLTVQGTSFTSNTETVEIEDNTLLLNKAETGAGVTAGSAGIEIERGTATNYQFVFDEASDSFQIGMIGSLQPVATRQATPTDTGVAYWNASTSSFATSSTFVWNGTTLSLNSKPVAQRQAAPTNTGVAFWNNTTSTFDTATTLVWNGTNLQVNSKNVLLEGGVSALYNYSTKTSAYTAVANDYIFATAGGWTLTLPASPAVGTTIFVLDVNKLFGTSNLTLGRNSSNIEAIADDMLLDVDGEEYKIVYTGASVGWRVL